MSRKSDLECLANELIHEVFDYLSTCEILYSFHPLNQRFSRLISQRSFQIDLTHLSKQQFEHAHRTLPLNQISALKISQRWTINVLSRLSFRSMIHLRVLILSHVNHTELRSLFQSRDFSTILGQLNTLKIQSSFVNGLDRERLLVLRKIFSEMPKLRICQVPLIDVNDLEDLKPTFTLEQLRIDYCTMLCLDGLIRYLPAVQHLTVRIFTDLQRLSKVPSLLDASTICSNLRSLHISTISNIPFHHLEELFRHSFHRLEKFSFVLKTDAASQSCLDYLDVKRWEVFLRSVVSLIEFHCCLELPVLSEHLLDHCAKAFESNHFFDQHHWSFYVQTYTYSHNSILRLHTRPYPKRRLDIIPWKILPTHRNIYGRVRDLRLLIDIIPRAGLSHLSGIIYENVVSLTLIGNKTFAEQTFLGDLCVVLNLDRLRQLTIQLDNASQALLSKLIEKCSKLHTLSISTYQSWSKMIHLSSTICESSIRSLTVHELLVNLNPYERLRQLFQQLEVLSLSVPSTEDCYRLLTVLFIGHRSSSIDRLRSVTIKCDFDEPDAIARWLRDNIQRRLSYKCTNSALNLWL